MTKKAKNMTGEKILATLILDGHMAVTDEPCDSATLIAQYADKFFALAITSEGTLVLGFEGESPISIQMRDLKDFVNARRDGMIQ